MQDGAKDHVDAAGDERTVNNVMRHEYRVLDEAEKALMKEVKDAGAALLTLCDRIGAGRETALAKTKVEEAVMWAVKGLTK
ncbi:hypothetical protein CN234_16805 [Sinorhizobium meliloti]|uniref:Acb2/Tad1 domain-containing protein n=1 Tax=Rhizobium meliloti TaxID=382 RepID=UPI000FDC7200|nr:hypothetical protein [Sinorhizobium meliloti]RVG08812.1 hypothetical protein CN234_16805 [Sinorhizobium meliloti]